MKDSTKRSLHNSQAGLTIVELLVSMAIMTVLLMVMTEIFTTITSARKESKVNSAVSQDSQYLLARFSYDIARASAIVTPASLGGAGSGTLALTIGGATHTYAVNSGALQLTVSGGGTDAVSSSESIISGFNVWRYGNGGVGDKDTVRLTFTVTSRSREAKGPKTQTFTLTKGLR